MQSWSWVKNVHFSKALTPFISLLHIVLFYFLSCHCVLPSRLFVPWHFLKRSRCIVAFFDALSGCVCKDVCRLAISNWPFNQFQVLKGSTNETYIWRETFQADLPLMVSWEKYFCATLAIHNNFSVQFPPTHFLLL